MSVLTQKRVYQPSASGETEDPERYTTGGLHPIHLGDLLKGQQYRIVHKLGFGSFSTNWLARDELKARYVSLKLSRANAPEEHNELRVLRYLAADQTQVHHHGRDFVMKLLDDFVVAGPNGNHRCYVTQVAGRRIGRPDDTNDGTMKTSRQLALQLVEALRYLNALKIAHADLYTSNILLQLANFDAWSDEDIYDCLGKPSIENVHRLDGGPRMDTVPMYCVQRPDLAALERRLLVNKVLLIDFGQAFNFGESPLRIATPAQFSAPEVLYRREITPAIDKWAMGCTIFEICSGYSLFKMIFSSRNDVMKDMVAMLGKPSEAIWAAWEDRETYFEPDGSPKKGLGRKIPVQPYPLSDRVRNIGLEQQYISGCEGPNGAAQSEDHKVMSKELSRLNDLLQNLMMYDPAARMDLDLAHSHPLFEDIHQSRL